MKQSRFYDGWDRCDEQLGIRRPAEERDASLYVGQLPPEDVRIFIFVVVLPPTSPLHPTLHAPSRFHRNPDRSEKPAAQTLSPNFFR